MGDAAKGTKRSYEVVGAPRFIYASVAQLAEQLAVNQWVVGSSPTGGAIKDIYSKDYIVYYRFKSYYFIHNLKYCLMVKATIDVLLYG